MMWIRSLVAVPQLMSTSDVPPGTVASKTGGEQPTISRWILTLSISHSNYIPPACKPGIHRVLLMLGRVNVGGCWLWITYCRLSCVHHFNCILTSKRTRSHCYWSSGCGARTSYHNAHDLRAGSASYARHCKIGAATKVASTCQMHYPKKCFSQEPSMYILHESHTLLFWGQFLADKLGQPDQ